MNKLAVLQPGAAGSWQNLREDGTVPMPLSGRPAEEVLAGLAAALRQTDMLWPGHDDEDFVALRALAWARCGGYLREWPEWEALPDEQRAALIEDFLDYGDEYLTARPLVGAPMR